MYIYMINICININKNENCIQIMNVIIAVL